MTHPTLTIINPNRENNTAPNGSYLIFTNSEYNVTMTVTLSIEIKQNKKDKKKNTTTDKTPIMMSLDATYNTIVIYGIDNDPNHTINIMDGYISETTNSFFCERCLRNNNCTKDDNISHCNMELDDSYPVNKPTADRLIRDTENLKQQTADIINSILNQ